MQPSGWVRMLKQKRERQEKHRTGVKLSKAGALEGKEKREAAY